MPNSSRGRFTSALPAIIKRKSRSLFLMSYSRCWLIILIKASHNRLSLTVVMPEIAGELSTKLALYEIAFLHTEN